MKDPSTHWHRHRRNALAVRADVRWHPWVCVALSLLLITFYARAESEIAEYRLGRISASLEGKFICLLPRDVEGRTGPAWPNARLYAIGTNCNDDLSLVAFRVSEGLSVEQVKLAIGLIDQAMNFRMQSEESSGLPFSVLPTNVFDRIHSVMHSDLDNGWTIVIHCCDGRLPGNETQKIGLEARTGAQDPSEFHLGWIDSQLD